MKPNMEEDLAAARRAVMEPDYVYEPCEDEVLYTKMPILACEEILYLRARVDALEAGLRHLVYTCYDEVESPRNLEVYEESINQAKGLLRDE